MNEYKILHVIKGLGRGGAERLLVETILLHSKVFRFDVVYFLPYKYHLVKELEQLGCRVYLLPATKTPAILLRLPSLVKLIRTNKYDLIHCHLPWAGILGRIAARISGVPIVYTEHNNFFTYHPVTRFFHKIYFKWFKYVIAVSPDAEQALRKALPNYVNLITILNGVNTDKFNKALFDVDALKKSFSLRKADFVVSTVAVFRKQKRLDRWLAIAQHIIMVDNQVRFMIVGDGPLDEELRMLSKNLGISDNVIFTGLMDDPRLYLACSDVYMMSSDYEGLPIALLEAMSMGCVPVVTAVGGIPSVIQMAENGLLYDGERYHEAVEHIIKLKNNLEQRLIMASRTRQRVQENYSMTRMIKELEDVYKKCLTK